MVKAHKWGMVIDLDRCTGCQACVIACQAENNVPVNEEVDFLSRRAKQWIRIDRVWEGEWPNIKARFMPVICQHCENAPCEPVCPVTAIFAEDATPPQWASYIPINYDYFTAHDTSDLKRN